MAHYSTSTCLHTRGENHEEFASFPWDWDVTVKALKNGRILAARTYYWMTYNPPYQLEGPETDVTSLCEGYITVTPLHFDLTRYDAIAEISKWNWGD